jgi:ATP-dependent helicase/nuclease subunit B
MQASVAAALAAGRSVIVPSPQRAVALGLAWARAQIAGGKSVWPSPDILTWDAWIRREWERASASGLVPADLLCLDSGQELLVWERALLELEPEGGLRQFAPDLMRAAARAVQEGVRLSGARASEEEALLVRAFARVRELGKRESLVALSLLPLEELERVVQSVAAPNVPLIVGQQRLTAMQSALAARKWPATQMLDTFPGRSRQSPQLVRTDSFEAEIRAAADWCQRLLEQDGTRRLLIVSALAEPRLPALGNLLWRELSAGTAQEITGLRDPALLAIEGGEPLLEHGLIADALDALQLMVDPVETTHLGRVLLSPYCGLGPDSARARLELQLRDRGRARWSSADLQRVLASQARNHPVATLLAGWLSHLARLAGARAAPASTWAREFSACLARCAFAAHSQLDSRDAQRLERWNELLDEFASLDCVSGPMGGTAALQRLRTLAARGRHRAASGDAAITLTDELGDPVVDYDGIWVLGLSEDRWPRPPRPNPFVPLTEQRRCNWPEAGATQRLEQARWAQQAWAARASQLVLSYPAMEGDVHHRPSSLLPAGRDQWIEATARYTDLRVGQARPAMDESMPAIGAGAAQGSGPRQLRNGIRLLELQQQCAFRAQAQLRLGAEPLETTSDGLDKRLRGTLLHRALEGLWNEFQDQQHLAALNQAQRQEAIDRCWKQALSKTPWDSLPADARVMEREGLRTRRILQRVLDLELQRTPFRVRERELSLTGTFGDWSLNLRIDRVDELQDGSTLLIDYKSGAPDRMRLDDANARPIQLAAYVAALAARGEAADAAALLSLSPKQKDFGFSGRAKDATLLPRGIKQQEGWEDLATGWQLQIRQLVLGHVGGVAQVAPLPGACDHCHLDSLCRITDHPPEPDDETAGE